METDRPTSLAACVVTLADLPEPPLCCRHADECGYRRGYSDGYRYALDDAGKHGWRPSDTLWAQIETFFTATLLAWRKRAWRQRDEPTVTKEWGPRFHQETVRRKKGA